MRSPSLALILLGCAALLQACAPSTRNAVEPTLAASPTPIAAPPTDIPEIDLEVLMSRRPLTWFAPLPPMPTHPGREYIGSEDFMSLFEPEAAWQNAARHVQVFKLYGEWVAYHATNEELQRAVTDIQRRGMALAVEAGPLNAPDDCGQGIEGFAGIEEGMRIAARIRSAGGTLNLIAMDEPYFFGHVYDGPHACRWDAAKIAVEVDKFIKAMQEEVPGVIIGDTEPLAGAADAAAYIGWLDTFRQVNGYDLAFLHMDVDWSRSTWPEEIKAVAGYGAQIGVPVGMIYFGNHVDRSDEGWISAAGERVKRLEIDTAVAPEHVLFQSWQDKPDRVLPETEAFTFTSFIDAYFTDRAALGFPREGPGANLALGKSVRVSKVFADQEGRFAVDGDLGTMWSAGDFPLQWIEIDLGAPSTVAQVNLTASQYPTGETVHRLLARSPTGEFELLHTFEEVTFDGTVLTFALPQALSGIQFIRVETAKSPSWVAWREIQVIGGG